MKTTLDAQNSIALEQKDIMDNNLNDTEKNKFDTVTTDDQGQKETSLEVEVVSPELGLQTKESEPSLTPELEAEYRELLEQEIERHKKVIVSTALSEDLLKRFQQAILLLKDLEKDVEGKQQQALEKNEHIKQTVQQLMQAGFIQVNEQEFKRSEESVQEYVRLLNDVKDEINEEMLRVTMMEQAEPGKEFAVWKSASDSYEEYVESRIKQIKHYVKSVKRDLNISYSRYCFGFDAQMRRIESIQRFVHRVQQQKKSNNSNE